MYRRNLIILLCLGALSLISLVGIQYYWFNKTWKLKNNEVDRLTHVALRETAHDLSLANAHVLNDTELVKRMSSNYYVVNINSQINPPDLEFYLSKNFEKNALNTDYEYAIYDCDTRQMVYGAYVEHQPSADCCESIDPKDLPTYDEFIYYFGVWFPNRPSFVLSQLNTQIYAALISLLILAFIVFSIYTILYQKRFLSLQKDFINSITHEFKTPITSLTLAGNLIQKHPLVQDDSKLNQYGNIILAQCDQLNKQVNNIFRLSKIERNELLLQKEDCDLCVLIEDIISGFDHRLDHTSASINFNTACDQAILYADKSHLSNVLINLIDNALKYNDNVPQVDIDLSKVNDHFNLTIKDNGIGIDPKEIKHIFAKFYRSKSKDTQKRNGFGLGLYYVKNICDLHAWKIKVESQLNSGSKFTLTF